MKSARLGAILIGVVLLSFGAKASDVAPTHVVMTDNGPVRGVETQSLDEFLGIPYAAPPVGKLRWKPPRAHDRWTKPLSVVAFGNECTQPGSSAGEVAGSEDCLFLNIFRPHQQKGQKPPKHLPVIVYIHGGGLRILSGNFDNVTPALLQNGNVIVASMNYRLGTLGFFSHPALDDEGHLNGNYGLMDQQFALKWLRRNIAAFGGDPHRITIFGTSAGALSVYSQLASPTAAGLFQRAIAVSGSYEGGFTRYQQSIVPIATAEGDGESFAAKFGCITARCLREIPAAQIVLAQQRGDFFPVIDGIVLRQTPGAAFASGQFNQVPVISGTSHDDYRFVVAIQFDFGSGPLTEAGYPAAIAGLLDLPETHPFVNLVNSLYPLSNYDNNASIALGAVGTDRVFACPALSAHESLARWVPTYVYEFNDENAPSFFDRPVSFPLGAYHTVEILYLLRTDQLDPDQHQLSDIMINYWTQFAATGDPNSADVPEWPLFDSSNQQIQSMLPPTPQTETGFASDHMCAFWTP